MNRKKEWFKEWVNYTFHKADFIASETNEMIDAKNLRIVKIYSVIRQPKDDYGRQIGTESCKAISNFVLVEKLGDNYRIFPSSKFSPTVLAKLDPTEEHDLFVKKTSVRDRYRKPIHLYAGLDGKMISTRDAIKFCEMISTVDSNFEEVETPRKTAELSSICEKFNNYLEAKQEKTL